MSATLTEELEFIAEAKNCRGYIEEYLKIMKIGDSLPIEGVWFRGAYPHRRGEGYDHLDVFLASTPGANYGAFTVDYDSANDHYIIHCNEFSTRRVYVEPSERHKYRQSRDGFWHRKGLLS